MKRIVFICLIGSLTFMTLCPISSAAEVKTPACSKIGTTKIQANIAYICKKYNGKLMWEKSKSQISTRKQINSENVALIKTAFRKVRSYSNQNSNIKLQTYLDEKVSPKTSQWIVSAQENVLRRFSGNLATETQIFSIIGSNNDFARTAYADIERKIGAPMGQVSGESENMLATCSDGCAFASAALGKQTLPYLTYLKPNSNLSTKEVGAHETFHAIQISLDKTAGNLPCWIREGQASFIGSALANPQESFDDTIEMIRSFGGMHSAGSDLSKIESPEGWKGHAGNCQDVGEYQVGRIANAYLVGKHGMAQSLQYLKAMDGRAADGKSWKEVFQETFGQSVPMFYAEAKVFIEWFFQYYKI